MELLCAVIQQKIEKLQSQKKKKKLNKERVMEAELGVIIDFVVSGIVCA